MKTYTEIFFSFWLTLFYSIPLLALTHRQNDGRTEEQINPGCVGHPDGFLQVNTLLLYSLDLYWQMERQTEKQIYIGWAGHLDGFLQVKKF